MQRMNGAIQEIRKSSDETAKIIKVIDEIPDTNTSLAQWTRQVRGMLGVDSSKEIHWPDDGTTVYTNLSPRPVPTFWQKPMSVVKSTVAILCWKTAMRASFG